MLTILLNIAVPDKMKKATFWILMTLILFSTIIMGAYWYYTQNVSLTEYKKFVSPLGDYEIVVYQTSEFPIFIPPGQAGDRAGLVRLYDRNRNIIKERKVDMVQKIDQVSWTKNKVSIKLFIEWDLPEDQP